MFNYLGLKVFYFLIIVTILFGFIFTISSLFVPLLIALFVTMMLRPLVVFFESKGFSQMSIIAALYALFFGGLVFVVYVVVPMLIEQITHFSSNMPHYMSILKAQLASMQETLSQKQSFIDVAALIEEAKSSLGSTAHSVSGFVGNYISDIVSILTFSMLVPFFVFFMLKDMHVMNKTLLSYIPNRYFEIVVLLFYKIGNSVQMYIRGQLIDASFVGVATAIGLSIIGFPFALLVGLIAGIGNFVPYFGPILGAIPAVLIMIVTPEWATATAVVSVVAVFLTVQIIETIFVYPIAVGNSVNLHPLIIVLALLVGGEVGGILGMIVVIPLVSIIKVTFELLYQYMGAYKIIRN